MNQVSKLGDMVLGLRKAEKHYYFKYNFKKVLIFDIKITIR